MCWRKNIEKIKTRNERTRYITEPTFPATNFSRKKKTNTFRIKKINVLTLTEKGHFFERLFDVQRIKRKTRERMREVKKRQAK